ncbi:MAG: ABC transporter permease subunit, partial [Firmicutes bacterium]|nr:ABC transporter permease subunit [Bacillota bacterium]
MKNDTNKSKYLMWLSAVIWILIWFVISRIVGSDVILPSPVSTVKALLGLLKTSGFYLNVLWTVLRTVIGIVVSFAVGAILAAFSAKHMTLKEFLRLPVSFFKSIPVMAIIIYVILVVKSDWVAIVVCFLMCFPIAYTNILNGLQSIDRSRVELGRSLGLTGMQTMRYILRPALDTEIRTALGLIAAMSWKVVVASEVLAIPKFSIGYQMLNSKYYLETPDLF